MKAKSILKIAVVAMAALGAYAFNGNVKEQDPFKEVYLLKDGGICTNILARCSNNGDFDCQIEYLGLPMDAFELGCSVHIKHRVPNTHVEWTPISP